MNDFPAHSAFIWLGEDGGLRLGLPASLNHTTSHSIKLRSDEIGLRALVQILAARLQASAEAKIGTKAVPTQALAEQLAKVEARNAEADKLAPILRQVRNEKRRWWKDAAGYLTQSEIEEKLNTADALYYMKKEAEKRLEAQEELILDIEL